MNIGTWFGRLAGATVVATVIAACSNSTGGGGDDDDTSPPGSDGGGGGDGSVRGGGDANADSGDGSPTMRITSDSGACVSNCHEGDPCSGDSVCASGTCTAGACADPSCTDGKKDGTETASDCGGTCAACADGIACLVGGDCTSGVCDPKTKLCDAPTFTDMVKNGTETDTDCGSSGTGEADDAPACADGKMCIKGTDCVDKECGTNGTCTPSSCKDGVQNGTETGQDCGGMCNPCADGIGCAADSDCTSKSCDITGTKLCLAPTSSDHIQNGNETDTDCGSSGTGEDTKALACADASKCGLGTDCIDKVCTGGTCAAATCKDTVQNGYETGPDCGGGAKSGCAACADGSGCKTGTDCTSLSCDTTKDVCLAPTSGDMIQNGNETDTDCGSGGGGTNAENTHALPCATGKKCVGHADCVADGCNYNGICIAEPSCAQHSGGDTCGAGEIDETTNTEEANSAHESCCASVALPAPLAATRLDKYEITAGRMREFVNRTGGDIATWWASYVKANPTSVAAGQIRSQDVQYLPSSDTDPYISTFKYNDQPGKEGTIVQEVGLHLGLYSHIGATVIFSDKPSDLQGCYIGASGSGSYGHPTYWWSATDMSDMSGGYEGAHAYTQEQMDEKSLNCVTEMMLVAFCAWDGGHLASSAELNAAWTKTYPWGDTPAYTDTWTTTEKGRVNPTYDSGNGKGDVTVNTSVWSVLMPTNNGTNGLTAVNLNAPRFNTTNWNPFYPTLPSSLRYYWPPVDLSQWGVQVDESYEIAAPGRFINDKSTLGDWYDLGANMIEATSTVVKTDDDNHDDLPMVYWNGGSFEGHGVGKNAFTENILTKYGKVGGRCAR